MKLIQINAKIGLSKWYCIGGALLSKDVLSNYIIINNKRMKYVYTYKIAKGKRS